MEKNQKGKPKRFKGKRICSGEKVVRVIKNDDFHFKTIFAVVRLTRKYIFCQMPSLMVGKSNQNSDLIIFDRRTGVDVRGEKFGYLESPKKENAQISTEDLRNVVVGLLSQGPNSLYNYCQ
jgi:hypothetical protein